MDGQALCYPAFPQLALIHEWHRDGVNHSGALFAALAGRDEWSRDRDG
jgi:hypothetical protein